MVDPYFVFVEEHSYRMLNPGMFTVTLDALETVDGKLRFKPTEV